MDLASLTDEMGGRHRTGRPFTYVWYHIWHVWGTGGGHLCDPIYKVYETGLPRLQCTAWIAHCLTQLGNPLRPGRPTPLQLLVKGKVDQPSFSAYVQSSIQNVMDISIKVEVPWDTYSLPHCALHLMAFWSMHLPSITSKIREESLRLVALLPMHM